MTIKKHVDVIRPEAPKNVLISLLKAGQWGRDTNNGQVILKHRDGVNYSVLDTEDKFLLVSGERPADMLTVEGTLTENQNIKMKPNKYIGTSQNGGIHFDSNDNLYLSDNLFLNNEQSINGYLTGSDYASLLSLGSGNDLILGDSRIDDIYINCGSSHIMLESPLIAKNQSKFEGLVEMDDNLTLRGNLNMEPDKYIGTGVESGIKFDSSDNVYLSNDLFLENEQSVNGYLAGGDSASLLHIGSGDSLIIGDEKIENIHIRCGSGDDIILGSPLVANKTASFTDVMTLKNNVMTEENGGEPIDLEYNNARLKIRVNDGTDIEEGELVVIEGSGSSFSLGFRKDGNLYQVALQPPPP